MKRNSFIKALIGLPLVFSQLSFRKPPKLEKTIFTPEMLSRHNFGLYIINVKAGNVLTTKNLGYAATVAWKLGYINHLIKNSNMRYGKIQAFTDGWFCPLAKDYEGLCEWLNNNPHGEEYRLLTKEEVIHLITNRQQGFL